MHITIADDHALTRYGIIMVLRKAHPDWTLSEAASFDDVVKQLTTYPAGLLLADLHMPGMDGHASLRALREKFPDTRIAVVTATEERSAILGCLGAGVHGYILKSQPPKKMLEAIETLITGGVYVPPMITSIEKDKDQRALAAASLGPPFGLGDGKHTHLTPRQTEVVKLLAEGRSTKEIARRLNLGLGTVKVHLAGVYRALGATNRMEAVVRSGRIKPGN